MNLVVRRRTALGGVAAATVALVAGLVVAPQVLAAPNGLSVQPNAAQNTETKVLTFTGQDTYFQYGGKADFSRLDVAAAFSVTIPANTGGDPVASEETHEGKATVNFSDLNDTNDNTAGGVGRDGPVDAGTYAVMTTGSTTTNPIQAELVGPGGGTDTCASCFLVTSAGPVAVASATPSSLRPGTNSNVAIAGNNFERGSVIELLLPGTLTVDTTITTNAPPLAANGDPAYEGITTRTSLLRRFTVGSGATTGPRDIRVRNLDGNSAICASCFTVAGPSLTSVNPPAGDNNPTSAPLSITFTGPSIVDGTPSLEFFGTPPAGTTKSALTLVGTRTAYTGTSITATFDLRNAAVGAYQPVVRGDTGFNACDICRFTVTQNNRTPTLTSMDSDTATVGIQKDIKQGETKTFEVNGTNFSMGASVAFTTANSGLTVTAVEFVSPELFRATVTAAANAGTGPKDAQVTLADGTTKSNVCAGCVNVVAGGSPTPTPTATATSSATPTATTSPGANCESTPTRVTVNTPTINATGNASVTVSGARPNTVVDLQGYSQNHYGTANFDNDTTPIDRRVRTDGNGSVRIDDLKPSSNTRVRSRQVNCPFGNSAVIEVRAQETLEVVRNGTRNYTFRGRSIPAREGGLIVSLYRIIGTACAAGVEPSRCPGERFIGQARAAALGAPNQGLYSIRIAFPAADQNVRDEFVVKTGRDAQNAPGRSNVRSLLIN